MGWKAQLSAIVAGIIVMAAPGNPFCCETQSGFSSPAYVLHILGSVGFRTHITIPANKQVLLAHADREKTTFEGLEDTLKVTNAQWQVWDLWSGKILLTIPKTTRTAVDPSPSLSNNGHFIYARQEHDLKIFSVAGTEK